MRNYRKFKVGLRHSLIIQMQVQGYVELLLLLENKSVHLLNDDVEALD